MTDSEATPTAFSTIFAGTFGPGSRVYHTGFVVPDLDEAIGVMTKALGVPFTPPFELPGLELWTPAGRRDTVLRLTYSTRPANVELIESAPGTLWDYDDRHRGHHLGVWADDVEAEAHRLAGLGMPALWWGVGADGRRVFSYHLTPYGVYIELVDTVAQAFYPQWFASVDPGLPPIDPA